MFANRGVNGRCWLSAAVFLLSFMLLVVVASPDAVQSQEGRLDFTVMPFADGTFYTGIDLADMDYDGDPEILIGNRNMDAVEIWEYDPNLDTLVQIDTVEGFPHDIHDVKAADFDNDGDMDVVVGLRFKGLWYVTNTGAPGTVGNWELQQINTHYAWQVLVEDFNQDGFLDIFHVLDIIAGGDILTYYGDGNGNFVPGTSIPDVSTGAGFDAVDLDGDGWLDLIGTVGNFMRAFLNPGNTSDSWESVGPPTSACSSPEDCTLESNISPSSGDLDGNGFLDQVAFRGHPTNTGIQAEVLIFEGSASGNDLHWEMSVLETIEPRFGYSVGVADLDEDGHLDVHFEGGHYFDGMRVYFGDGNGGFTPQIIALDHGVGGKNSLVMGDINSDGLQDIVTVRYTDSGKEYSGFEVLFRKFTADCTPPLDVDDQATLNRAIGCANAADSGTPVINLVGDVNLSGPTTPISNPQADSIEIEGNNYAIVGNSLNPILTMYSDTEVTLRNITISYGKPGIRTIDKHPPYRPLVVENSNFTQNIGAAIDARYSWGDGFGNLSIANSVVAENQGKGIATAFKYLTVDETTVHSNFEVILNEETIPGDGIWMQDSHSTITNSTVSTNQGDGITAFITVMTLQNATLSHNQRGIVCDMGMSRCNLANVTISDSESTSIYTADMSTVTLANTIIYNTNNGPACVIGPWGGWYIDGNFNIIKDDTCGGIEAGGDPLLGPLQDNGGPTWTRELYFDSPAIDAITDPNACVLDRDQRGVPRPQGAFCDIGAYEFDDSVPDYHIFFPTIPMSG
jgi:hypothetical protein